MNRFADRVVLVTGAGSGIGAATAARIRAEGGRVWAGLEPRAGQTAPAGARALALDVTDAAAWGAAAEAIGAAEGRLDALVNNAGARAGGRAEETDAALWQWMLDVNLTSILFGVQAMLPLLRRGRGASIVNLGSITGLRGTEGMLAYSAAKGGVVALTASLALDLAAEGIRVNAVCPGAIETAMVTGWLAGAPDPAAARARVIAKHPLGRLGRPEEVAAAIAFLASDDAAFMTGLSLPVDGGRSIR